MACQAKSPVRTVSYINVRRQGEFVLIDIEANAFLHHMVRNIAGVLMVIGAGEQQPIWAKQILEHEDRTKGGVTAPPYGLYLTGVTYDDEFNLPQIEEPSIIW